MSSPLLLDYHQGLDYTQILPALPLLVSQGQWKDCVLELHDAPAWEIPEYALTHHHLGVLLDQWQGERRIDGKRRIESCVKGAFSLVPAHMPVASRWQGRSRAIVLAIEPALLMRVGHDWIKGDRIELKFCMANEGDPFIAQILHLLKADLEAGSPIGSLYGESLITALVAHLLRNYVVFSPGFPTYLKGMPRYKLNPVLEYINTHLQEDMKLQDLANIANVSQFYFCRMFRLSMGMTPSQYVRYQRIERAKQLLKQRHLSISEISIQCGFTSQSHFTRLFYKFTRVTPKAYRDLI